MTERKDWANISDDEDESSEDSPENIPFDQPLEQTKTSEEQLKVPGGGEEAKPVDAPKVQGRRDNRKSEEDQKADLIKEIEALNGSKIFLNIYNLDSSIKADTIKEFYQPVTIAYVYASQTKAGLFDLELLNKEDAIKVIQKGTGNLAKSNFCLRISHRNYPKDAMRSNDKKDRDNKTYGQNRQGTRGGYDNQRYGKGEQDDYYYSKNQEGGQRNYERKNQDNRYGGRQDREHGSWKQQGGPRGDTQYQIRPKDKGQQEENKNEADLNRNEEKYKSEEQQFANARPQEQNAQARSDKWEKSQYQDEPRNKEYKKKDDYQRNYKNDKYQMKKYNSDYTDGGHSYSNRGPGYRGGEDNSDTIEKGRGTKKYNQDEPLEQDKILQLKDKQSSYKSQGSDKGYKKDYNKGYDKGYGGYSNYSGDNYNKSHYYNDQKGYGGRPNYKEKDSGGSYAYDEGLQIERKVSRPKDESYKVYTKKEPTDSTPTHQEKNDPPELAKKTSLNQSSKNTANPFNLLEK